jgi:hypothetical protein
MKVDQPHALDSGTLWRDGFGARRMLLAAESGPEAEKGDFQGSILGSIFRPSSGAAKLRADLHTLRYHSSA